MGSWSIGAIRRVIQNGFTAQKRGYKARPDGALYWSGSRPDVGWHRHGTTPRKIRDLRDGKAIVVTVHQQRWYKPGERTLTDRAPDGVGRLGFSVLVVAVAVASWLLRERGLHRYEPLVEGLEERPSTRTIQRWRARFAPHALGLQQALRTLWLDHRPRRAGDEFPGGVPPPLHPGPWRGRTEAYQLKTALSMVLGLAITTNQAGASLLAEARRRFPTHPFFTD